MGIRIHKALGYGVVDLVHDEDGNPTDKRLDPEGYFATETVIGDGDHSFENYVKFLETFEWALPDRERKDARLEHADLEMMLYHQATAKKKSRFADDFYRVVSHDGEFGMPNVLLVTPAMQTDVWYRHDDAIDYCEEAQITKKADNRIVRLSTAPFPFNVAQEYLKTGLARSEQQRFLDRGRKPRPRDWRWTVPPDVAAICKFLKLFKDDATIRTLEPLLYVWWA